jgi:hypothetical protein
MSSSKARQRTVGTTLASKSSVKPIKTASAKREAPESGGPTSARTQSAAKTPAKSTASRALAPAKASQAAKAVKPAITPSRGAVG